ncbi:hypothetical protein KUCAC02_015507 [Chaenocephalus aceratus]|uniref:Uncharacterized protein n=1 Tax=Chaenocephalus aceratus TaxID=36190 RepID=A0ACB9XZ09_CHAAC|nr:hypothetical protein KUCAC02_015507 [Chaenocephalus aceratus]
MSYSNRSYIQSSRTLSVYGGAGGRGTRVSSASQGYAPTSGGFNLTDGLDLHVGANEKATMQNLNDRLSSYLEKVRKLEKENEQLDKQIREFCQNKVHISHDYTIYFAIIEDLKDKVRGNSFASRLNSKTVLDIDNAKLAADDFKMNGHRWLKRVLDEMNLARMDLESQYEALKEELIMLKRKSRRGESELILLRSQMGGQVNVAVEASPSQDLNLVMSEIREHYETMIGKNRKELEAWYQSKIAVVEQDVITHTQRF